ncbi:MAG: biopolymer transporter ExbD [Betaproteobacteria bacterium]|jgi:biopolymer transport protein ExbD|uniref:Putative Biopolymer transport protein ExbD/TolR n=1 Tax=Thiomonas delicata TaxID=364030 RepID=A0A238D7I4_THIDL|nr:MULTISPECIES: biopolymer transporter ExbD [Thiomonas]MDE2129971.1 biopolymer transporter ExbD [Betaproteobacteria bacterium]OZB44075.1 MAG: biopolymer transporter ExbD [Thiomonas sp. 15-66-11]OZB49035.1 MAG: biopolymer transporter ExbD [Thiomonas sp. 14-66-4]SBP89215.1 putative Biopolymer transport protein ExbD/TolR [Thiomonas delicata]
MNFQRHHRHDDPEINLIPLIDVLLVILIFLMITTTYSKYTELKINLPTANAAKAEQYPHQIVVAVAADGTYAVNRQVLPNRTVADIANALTQAAKGDADAMVVISADAQSTQQSVINVMEAARIAGLSRLTFATQRAPGS